MFLHLCVCPRGGGGGGAPGQVPPRQVPPPPRQTATAADGTHPTGMHSCSKLISLLVFLFNIATKAPETYVHQLDIFQQSFFDLIDIFYIKCVEFNNTQLLSFCAFVSSCV